MTRKAQKEQSIIGAVLVAGAGIEGMQAALDLADAGFKVYLVEHTSFHSLYAAKGKPTTTPLFCRLSAKLLAVQTHVNIELMEHAAVETIQGAAGNFSVTIKTSAPIKGKSTTAGRAKASAGNQRELTAGAVIFAPGLNTLTALSRHDYAAELRRHAKQHGFKLNSKKPAQQHAMLPHTTSMPGIFVALGSSNASLANGIIEGSSVASFAAEVLSSRRGSLAPEKQYPAEEHSTGKEPRIGFFACQHIFSDTKAAAVLLGSARELASVFHVQGIPFICSSDALRQVKSVVAEHGLNRVVMMSCNPRALEPLYQEALAEAGLNRYLLEMTDIEHLRGCQAITTAAADTIGMAVARARMLEPLKEVTSEVMQSSLVIGSGLSALSAALCLAKQGYEVYLIEQALDGSASRTGASRKKSAADVLMLKRTLKKQIAQHRKIQVFTDARITACTGHPGSYTTTLSAKGAQKVLKHGTLIIEPGQVQDDLQIVCKLPVTSNGEYLRQDALLPLDLACGAMFCCGYADDAPGIRKSIVLGCAAAARAATILAKREIQHGGVIAIVDQEHCVACLACVRDCPYGAPSISEGGVAYIEPVECRGCGVCVSACPRHAIELKHYTDEQIMAELAVFAASRS